MEERTRGEESAGQRLKFLLRPADEGLVKPVVEAVKVIRGQLPSARVETADALLRALEAGKPAAADVLRFLMSVDETEADGVSFRAEDLAALEQLSSL